MQAKVGDDPRGKYVDKVPIQSQQKHKINSC